jgi:hypothetical protein
MRRTFLYHSLFEPVTGNRCKVRPFRTNQTSREIFRPDRRPVTVMVNSWTVLNALPNVEVVMGSPLPSPKVARKTGSYQQYEGQ